jgi:hypothetical protein
VEKFIDNWRKRGYFRRLFFVVDEPEAAAARRVEMLERGGAGDRNIFERIF